VNTGGLGAVQKKKGDQDEVPDQAATRVRDKKGSPECGEKRGESSHPEVEGPERQERATN